MKKSAPESLSPEAQTWWQRLVDGYAIEDEAGELLLLLAMESFDRLREAQALIAEHGAVTTDRFGQLRANPACTIERDSRSAMLGALKSLHLDLEPLRDAAGRPPGR